MGKSSRFLMGIAAVAAMALSATVTAQVAPAGSVGAADSKHNLGSTGAGQTSATATTADVCVFCHTPHGASVRDAAGNLVSAPLWNRALPTTTYQRYADLGTATLSGAEAPVGSVSLACLSCHDGTQALDAVINAPGAGMGTGVGTVTMTGTPVPNLTTDLQDDHPISIQYARGACQNAVADCDPANEFRPAQHAQLNGQNQYWVDVATFGLGLNETSGGTGTADLREKTDILLYTRDNFAGATGFGPSVECGSCHDPHESVARPVQFMRISNANSAVCLACHIK